MNPTIEQAARLFPQRVRKHYDLIDAWLFGSQARQTAGVDRDADIAVLLRGAQGAPGARADAAVDMAGIAFDVMLVYYNRLADGRIWLLLIYAKSARDNLPAHVLNAAREMLDHAED